MFSVFLVICVFRVHSESLRLFLKNPFLCIFFSLKKKILSFITWSPFFFNVQIMNTCIWSCHKSFISIVKEWKKEASRIRQCEVTWVRLHLSAKLFWFLKKVYFSCYTLENILTLYIVKIWKGIWIISSNITLVKD